MLLPNPELDILEKLPGEDDFKLGDSAVALELKARLEAEELSLEPDGEETLALDTTETNLVCSEEMLDTFDSEELVL